MRVTNSTKLLMIHPSVLSGAMRDSQLRASIEAMQGGDADAERAKMDKTSVEGIVVHSESVKLRG